MLTKTFGTVESSDISAPAVPISVVSQDKSVQCSKLSYLNVLHVAEGFNLRISNRSNSGETTW